MVRAGMALVAKALDHEALEALVARVAVAGA